MVEGDIAVAGSNSATPGQKLIVNNTTGVITSAASAATGETDTDWVVKSLFGNTSAAGQVVIASK